MKQITLLLGVIGAVMVVYGALNMAQPQNSDNRVPNHITDMWTQWKMKHGRSYGVSSEDSYRLQVFYENYKIVTEKNNRKSSAQYELNKFADMSKEEFKKTYLSQVAYETEPEKTYKSTEKLDAPDSMDWTSRGAVTGIKDQGQCGSCWAFSATGALEGLNYLNTSQLKSFSEQQLLECSKSYGNMGCNGGIMMHAFLYTKEFGINEESAYPYLADDSRECNTSLQDEGVKINTGFTSVEIMSNVGLVNAIALQPVSVGVAADAWQHYKGGIFDDWEGCNTQTDHGVLAVGYGQDIVTGKLYYKVKNSWGAGWGESGYI